MAVIRNVADMKRPRVFSVLIADDDRVTRTVLRAALTKAGYSVVADAETGIQTVVLYDEKHPDIVLLDINMPKGSGLTTLRMIREINPNAKVVMLTGDRTPESVETALELGAADYVCKTSGDERILEALKNALQCKQ